MKQTNFMLALLFFMGMLHPALMAQPTDFTPVRRTLELNVKKLAKELNSLTEERPFDGILASITLPMLAGEERFMVQASPLMEPKMAAKHLEIKTFAVQNIQNPAITGRLTLAPSGLFGTILTPEGMVIIEPTDFNIATNTHIIYAHKSVSFNCGTTGEAQPRLPKRQHDALEKAFTHAIGNNIRTYRLAIVTPGEFYVQYGTNAATMIVSIINGIQAIYERDLAVRFQLLTPVIYTNPNTDPFVPDLAGGSDMVLQAANGIRLNFNKTAYDFGHLLQYHNSAWTGGGRAALNAVCSADDLSNGAPKKAGAFTAISGLNALENFISVGAHEMGHQFGMDHTFNGTGNACTSNIVFHAAYEIGSGSTIMSYMGNCGSGQNIPPSATDISYFHIYSIEQANAHINAIGSCALLSTTGNTPPTVQANPCGSTLTLPIGTPFTVTGTATDAQNDALTYTWEQYNEDGAGVRPTQGFIGYSASTSTLAPLFRSYPPSGSPSRTFPAMNFILNNNNLSDFEALPLVTRTIKLRLTVRDNNPNGGGVEFDELTLNVNGNAGPLAVTAPNGGNTWTAGSQVNVTWSVNNTHTIVANVAIKLSIDGGHTFPYHLGTFPNNGNAVLPLPAGITNTTQARIRVEGVVSNCFSFFDISNANFNINSSCNVMTPRICSDEPTTAVAGSSNLDFDFGVMEENAITTQSFSITTTDPTMPRIGLNSARTSCTTHSGTVPYKVFEFYVNQTGNYNIQFSNLQVAHLYKENFDPNNSCTNFISSTFANAYYGGIQNTPRLEACTKYILVVTSESYEGWTSTTATFSGPGQVYAAYHKPANTEITYAAVNVTNNQITMVSPAANFINLLPGSYDIYAISYKNGGSTPPSPVNPATFVGQTIANIIAGAPCVLFSNHAKRLTVQASSTSIIPGAYYYIRSAYNDGTTRRMYIAGPNAGAILKTDDAKTLAHMWQAIDAGNGQYYLKNVISGLYLAVDGQSQNNSAPFVQWYQYNLDHFKFHIVPAANGTFLIRAVHSNKLADLHLAINEIKQYDDSGGTNQRWYFEAVPEQDMRPIANGIYTIRNAQHDGQIRRIYSPNNNVGAVVAVNNQQTNQHQWELTYLGEGKYHIKNVASGLFFSVYGGFQTNDAALIQWTYENAQHFKFSIEPKSDGTFTLRAVHSHKVVDLYLNTNEVKQNTAQGTITQRWHLEAPGQTAGSIANGVYTIRSAYNDGQTRHIRVSNTNTGTVAKVNGQKTNFHLWEFTHIGAGLYTIKNVASGLYLSVYGGFQTNDAALIQWTYQDANHFKFFVEPAANGTFTIRSLNSNKLVNLYVNTSEVKQYDAQGTDNQRWYLEAASPQDIRTLTPGTYTIRSAYNDGQTRRMYVANNNAGTLVAVNNQQTTSHQWQVTSAGGGLYFLQNVASGLYLAVDGQSQNNSVPLVQWFYYNLDHFKFYIEPAADQTFILRAAHSDKAADLHVFINEVKQYDLHGTSNQRWYFESVGGQSLVTDPPTHNNLLTTPQAINNILSEVYPNPATDEVYVSVNMTQESTARLEIRSLTGKTMAVIHNNILSKGENLIKYNTGALATGIYLITLITDTGTVEAKKLVKR